MAIDVKSIPKPYKVGVSEKEGLGLCILFEDVELFHIANAGTNFMKDLEGLLNGAYTEGYLYKCRELDPV